MKLNNFAKLTTKDNAIKHAFAIMLIMITFAMLSLGFGQKKLYSIFALMGTPVAIAVLLASGNELKSHLIQDKNEYLDI